MTTPPAKWIVVDDMDPSIDFFAGSSIEGISETSNSSEVFGTYGQPYLGTLHGADHWRLRGAGGLELGEQLPELVSAQWNRLARVLGSNSAAAMGSGTGSPSRASAAAAAVARSVSS